MTASIPFRPARRDAVLAGALLGLWLCPALGATQEQPPTLGQEGKDAPWVPTPQELVDTMLDMAEVTADDLLIDLGAGDGRVVISAAHRGARAIGVELDPGLVELAKTNAAAAGVSALTEFVTADIFEFDFSSASVVSMFLLPELTLRLRPTLFDLRPGTRIVSNTWDMRGTETDPEARGWDPDQTIVLDPCPGFCTAHVWTVPAKVAGTWRLEDGRLLHLTQRFQEVRGQFESGGVATEIFDGRLDGTTLTFRANGVGHTAEVDQAAMRGTTGAGGNTNSWGAQRVP